MSYHGSKPRWRAPHERSHGTCSADCGWRASNSQISLWANVRTRVTSGSHGFPWADHVCRCSGFAAWCCSKGRTANERFRDNMWKSCSKVCTLTCDSKARDAHRYECRWCQNCINQTKDRAGALWVRRVVRCCGCAVEANAEMVKKFPLCKISIAGGGDEEPLPVRRAVRGGIKRCLNLEK